MMRSAYGRQTPPPEYELTCVEPGSPMGELLRRYWQPVCKSDELRDLPKKVKLLCEENIGSDRSCCATVLSFTASIASTLQAVASRFPSSLFGPSGLAQPRRRRRPGQAEMVAQRLALVVAAEEAAVLEFRHDQVDKMGECAREIGRQYVVTVGGALDEPLFKGVGNPSWGAADDPVAARRGGKVVEVAQGHVLPPSHVVEHAVEGAAAFGRRRRRYRAIERVAADIVTVPATYQRQGGRWCQ